MVVSDNAARAGGNGGVTLQLRYRSGTVSKGFLNRCAGAGVKLLPGAHQLQIAQRRPLHLRKSGDTGNGRGYLEAVARCVQVWTHLPTCGNTGCARGSVLRPGHKIPPCAA